MAWALGHVYVLALQPAAKGFCFISAFKTNGIFFPYILKSNAKRLVFLRIEASGPSDPVDCQERGKMPTGHIFKSMVGC